MADSGASDGWPTESSSYVIREDIGQVCGIIYMALARAGGVLAGSTSCRAELATPEHCTPCHLAHAGQPTRPPLLTRPLPGLLLAA